MAITMMSMETADSGKFIAREISNASCSTFHALDPEVINNPTLITEPQQIPGRDTYEPWIKFSKERLSKESFNSQQNWALCLHAVGKFFKVVGSLK
jgi:hypothetical protein